MHRKRNSSTEDPPHLTLNHKLEQYTDWIGKDIIKSMRQNK